MNLASIHNLLKRKRKAWVAQLCCAQETGKPDGRLGQVWPAFNRRITPLHRKTAISKKLLLPRRRLLQYSSLFMAPAHGAVCSVGYVLMRSRHFFLLIFLVCI